MSRKNVRQFTDRAIERSDLDRILEAGRRAPSAQNWQPWDFVVVTDPERLRELSKVWQGAGHVARSAATVAMIAPTLGDEHQRARAQFDLGQSTMSMMLAATDLGVASAHASVADQQLARKLLGLPEDRVCVYLIALGYPAGRPLAPIDRPDRRPFDEVVHRERW